MKMIYLDIEERARSLWGGILEQQKLGNACLVGMIMEALKDLAKTEREACARIAENLRSGEDLMPLPGEIWVHPGFRISAAIRSRD